jgi:hypothetical protein
MHWVPSATRPCLWLGAILLAGLSQPASAKPIVVSVDAHSGPWSQAKNPNLSFGVGDEAAPVVVGGLAGSEGGKAEIWPVGTTSVDGQLADGKGLKTKEADDSPGPHGKRYPSFYTPKILYPAQVHALIGAFVDASGVIVGRPFVIGAGVRVPIPDGAAGVALGFNDESFAANAGQLQVTVNVINP